MGRGNRPPRDCLCSPVDPGSPGRLQVDICSRDLGAGSARVDQGEMDRCGFGRHMCPCAVGSRRELVVLGGEDRLSSRSLQQRKSVASASVRGPGCVRVHGIGPSGTGCETYCERVCSGWGSRPVLRAGRYRGGARIMGEGPARFQTSARLETSHRRWANGTDHREPTTCAGCDKGVMWPVWGTV